MVDLKTLKQLVRLMIENDLTELDVEAEGTKVKLKRGSGSPDVHMLSPAHASPSVSANTGAPAATSQGGNGQGGEQADGIAIKSPMVGTFYTAPSPDEPPFVSVGDSVDPSTVVCLVEAMKVFNEIKAEIRGTITRVLVDTGQSVEFDQPLFLVKPD